DARSAVPDIELMDGLSAQRRIGMRLYPPLEAAPGALRFKLAQWGAAVTLSDSLPMLEHMGVRVLEERPYRIQPAGGTAVWPRGYGMSVPHGGEGDSDALHGFFEEAFARVFAGEVENDDFNRLVVVARLRADEVVVLRACAKYLQQIGFALSQ